MTLERSQVSVPNMQLLPPLPAVSAGMSGGSAPIRETRSVWSCFLPPNWTDNPHGMNGTLVLDRDPHSATY